MFHSIRFWREQNGELKVTTVKERQYPIYLPGLDLGLDPPGQYKIPQTGTYSPSLRTTYVKWHLTIPRIGTMVLTSLMPLITHGIKACYDRHTFSVQPECPAKLQSKHMTLCRAYNRDSSLCTTGHCFIASFFCETGVEDCSHWDDGILFLKCFGGHQFFCGATDTPFLHFWWHLPWVSKPGLDPLTFILHCLYAM